MKADGQERGEVSLPLCPPARDLPVQSFQWVLGEFISPCGGGGGLSFPICKTGALAAARFSRGAVEGPSPGQRPPRWGAWAADREPGSRCLCRLPRPGSNRPRLPGPRAPDSTLPETRRQVRGRAHLEVTSTAGDCMTARLRAGRAVTGPAGAGVAASPPRAPPAPARPGPGPPPSGHRAGPDAQRSAGAFAGLAGPLRRD